MQDDDRNRQDRPPLRPVSLNDDDALAAASAVKPTLEHRAETVNGEETGRQICRNTTLSYAADAV